jgi:hypothetical protein
MSSDREVCACSMQAIIARLLLAIQYAPAARVPPAEYQWHREGDCTGECLGSLGESPAGPTGCSPRTSSHAATPGAGRRQPERAQFSARRGWQRHRGVAANAFACIHPLLVVLPARRSR